MTVGNHLYSLPRTGTITCHLGNFVMGAVASIFLIILSEIAIFGSFLLLLARFINKFRGASPGNNARLRGWQIGLFIVGAALGVMAVYLKPR